MKSCFIYCRQSSGCGDAVNSLSIQQQLTNCLELSQRMELEVAGVFTDANVSGKTYPSGTYFEDTAAKDRGFQRWFEQQTGTKKFRAGLGNMMERLKEVSFIIVDEITRLHRAAADSFLEQVLTFEITKADVKIIQVKGGLLDLKSFDQSLIHILKTRINDEQIANQKRKSIESRKKLKDSGIFCNVKFYGAVYEGNKKFHFDSAQSEVVRFIFDHLTRNVPVSRIVDEVNQKFPGRFNQAKRFYTSTLRHIVTQPLYAGLMYNSQGELIQCCNAPQPLIAESTFFKAASIIADRQCHASKPRKESTREPLIFSGFLRCGNCGSDLVAVYDRKRIVYKCRYGDNKGDPGCKESRILVSGGTTDAGDLAHSLAPLLVIAFIKQQKFMKLAQTGQECLEKLKIREITLRNKMKAAFELWEENILDEETYKASVRCSTRKIQQIKQEQAEIADLHRAKDEICARSAKWQKIIDGVVQQRSCTCSTDYREMLLQSVEHITVGKESVTVSSAAGRITIPRIPYDGRQLRVMPRSRLKKEGGEGKVFYKILFFSGKGDGCKKKLLEWENLHISLHSPDSKSSRM